MIQTSLVPETKAAQSERQQGSLSIGLAADADDVYIGLLEVSLEVLVLGVWRDVVVGGQNVGPDAVAELGRQAQEG